MKNKPSTSTIAPLVSQDQPWVSALARNGNIYCPNCRNHDLGYSAAVSGKKIAYIVWQIAADEATLLGIAVQQPYQRQGIARQLHQHSEAILKQRGIATLFLEVRQNNHHAQRCYDKLGYQTIATRPNYYRQLNNPNATEDALVMRKLIRSLGKS